MTRASWLPACALWLLTSCSPTSSTPEPELPPRPSAVASSPAIAPPTVDLPRDAEGIAKLIQDARDQPATESKHTYELAARAVGAMTGAAGSPSVIGTANEWFGPRTELLREGRAVEVATWRLAGMRVTGERALTVGERAVTLERGVVTVWGSQPEPITSAKVVRIEAPAGEERFVLAFTDKASFVIDTVTAEKLHVGWATHTALQRTAAGETRLAQSTDSGFVIVDLGSQREIASFARVIALDADRGFAAVRSFDVSDDFKTTMTTSVVRLVDGTPIAQMKEPFDSGSEPFASYVIDPTGAVLGAVEMEVGQERLLRIDLRAGTQRVLGRWKPEQHLLGRPVFTEGGRHLCVVDVTGDAFIPGSSLQCVIAQSGVARAVHLAPPPVGFRRVEARDFPELPGYAQKFIHVDDRGLRVAAVTYAGKPLPLWPMEVGLAVYDARTGKELWNAAFPAPMALDQLQGVEFSQDGSAVLFDDFEIDAKTGKPLEPALVDTADLAPMLQRFGLVVPEAGIPLQNSVLPFVVEGMVQRAGLYAGRFTDRPLQIVHDRATRVTALRAVGSGRAIVFVSAKAGGIAFLPDGEFAVAGQDDDLVCMFGPIAAPIALCQANRRDPSEVNAILTAIEGEPATQ